MRAERANRGTDRQGKQRDAQQINRQQRDRHLQLAAHKEETDNQHRGHFCKHESSRLTLGKTAESGDQQAKRQRIHDGAGEIEASDFTPANVCRQVTQGEDNSYYLKHLYDGTANKVGCLFIDYENAEDFSDNNTIIYGHNMRDGSMFAALNEYDEQSYFDTHKQMYLVTPEGGYLCEVFAAFVAKPSESGSDTSPWRLSWKDDGAYTTWLTAMAERSVVETDVTVTSSDKVLTLSTCTPGGASRFIVMAKLVEVNNEAD